MAFGQVFLAHAVLDTLDIVLDPVPLPSVISRVQDGVSGARVAVARLTDRARVEDGTRGEGHLGDVFGHDQLGGKAVIRQVIQHGQVGVTHEAVGSFVEFKADGGRAGVKQVFPDGLERATMHQGDELELDPVRQIFEVFLVGGGEPLQGPQDGLAGIRVESIHFDGTHRGCIVVAHDALQVGQLTDALDAFIRVGAVTDEVTQAPGGIVLPGISQHGFEGGEVGMDIGNDQGPHALMVA